LIEAQSRKRAIINPRTRPGCSRPSPAAEPEQAQLSPATNQTAQSTHHRVLGREVLGLAARQNSVVQRPEKLQSTLIAWLTEVQAGHTAVSRLLDEIDGRAKIMLPGVPASSGGAPRRYNIGNDRFSAYGVMYRSIGNRRKNGNHCCFPVFPIGNANYRETECPFHRHAVDCF
jgi:hypothetical protein